MASLGLLLNGLLVLFGPFVRLMVTDHASGCRAKRRVMSSDMSRNAAHDSALYAAFR